MNIAHRPSTWIPLLLGCITLSLSSLCHSASCSGDALIDVSLPGGAAWELCWELRAEEGIVIKEVNSREKPLALYIYSKNRRNIDKILSNTRAGGSCINHNAAHFFNTHLPFGGSNNSGIGKSHGIFGFQEFSNMRSVLKQHTKGAMETLFPSCVIFILSVLEKSLVLTTLFSSTI